MRKKKDQTVLISSSEEFFDDCPICQVMKKAQEEKRKLSQKEVEEAFKKAKGQGVVVGGPLDQNLPDKKLTTN